MSKKSVASNLVHYLYSVMNSIGGDEIEICRDPLGGRFEVNRYGIEVRHRDGNGNGSRLRILREQIIDFLRGEGWASEVKFGRVELLGIYKGHSSWITVDPVIDEMYGVSLPPKVFIHIYIKDKK